MNLYFNGVNREGHTELKTRLDDNKIKYKVIDDDAFTVEFKVKDSDSSSFQMDLVNNVLGSSVPGTFSTEY